MTRRSAYVAFVGITLALGGCVSPEQIRANEQATCAGYGFEPGSTDFAQCMMTVDQERRNREAAAATAWDAHVYSTPIPGEAQSMELGQSSAPGQFWQTLIPLGGGMYETWP
jgi:hypothetical protein